MVNFSGLLVNNYLSIRERFSNLLYVFYMSGKKKKTTEQPIFDSIRKPLAPPSKKFGENKPEEKAHPSKRKTKHKHKEDGD